MQYILAHISLPTLIQDIAALVVSIFVGFFIWIIKQSYDGYIQELKSLKRLEIFLSSDLATNMHNEEYLNDWIGKLRENKLFSCAFRVYSLDNSVLIDISNLKLVNKINSLTHGLNVLFNDLKNMYDTYISNTYRLLEKDNVDLWKKMNINTLDQIETIKNNFTDSEKDIKEAVAYLRGYYNQRRFSIFRMFSIFSYNIYPKLTDKKVQLEIIALDKNLADKAKASTKATHEKGRKE